MNRALIALAAALPALAMAGTARACGDPPEQWYEDVSDVVFEASAFCTPERRSCRLRVTNVLKNPDHLAIERRPFEVDYQNWNADWHDGNSDRITWFCGAPYFEPAQQTFRARFYANLDEETSELIIRRAVIRENRRSRAD